jgi:dephospho-CoA kinase
MRKIGLTGGIGSGKSSVASLLASIGVRVLDADALARSVTLAGGAAMPEIRRVFGDTVIAANESLNRDAMRDIILRDSEAKSRLEAIVHPLIGGLIDEQLETLRVAGVTSVVVDIPLLVEGGRRWRDRLDAVWVVDCLPQTQVARVQARNGWPLAQIHAVMAAQAARHERLKCADLVIFNDAISLAQLERLVRDAASQQKLV